MADNEVSSDVHGRCSHPGGSRLDRVMSAMPTAYGPNRRKGLRRSETPFLAFDTSAAVRAYERIQAALPRVDVHYAVKCQPAACAALAAAGARFEVASAGEMNRLLRLGVRARDLVFSHPVKFSSHIRAAFDAGVPLYAFGCREEVHKLAANAPGASVMVRLATRPEGSTVPSEGKFGVDVKRAVELLADARAAGLDPAGIAFHVGSQCVDPSTWAQAIEDAAQAMNLADKTFGIRIRVLDIGGGFPAAYALDPPPPPIEEYGRVICQALATRNAGGRLPYPVERVIAEPGRAVVAEAGTMVATVITADKQTSRVYLNVGAFQLFESLETGRKIPWRVTDTCGDPHTMPWQVYGQTCDSADGVIDTQTYPIPGGAELSCSLAEGDTVIFNDAGAYTTTYYPRFCDFPDPEIIHLTPIGGEYDSAAYRAHTSAATATAATT